LPENSSKYEVLLSDLNVLEKTATNFKNKLKATVEKNQELTELLEKEKQSKLTLFKKIDELEKEVKQENNNGLTNLFNIEEKEELKSKLKELISRIDFHLSADRHV